ncbi:MAG: hypothetical protein KBA64_00885 [Armatimonadetes bacterium]|jgi:hypothetical protein|nr:hypothetical protein [Armatimonadota bacterium]NLN91109.1 hypothetical protein [candidate division WS1 bacterium]
MAQQPHVKRDIWASLLKIDRRIVFVFIFVALTVPFLIPGMNVPVETQPPAEKLFAAIEALPSGSDVIISFDYGPSTKPELSPMATALARHCFSRDIRIYATAFYLEGPAIGEQILREVAEEYGKEEHVDYVNLGYKPGGPAAVIMGMAAGVSQVFPTDKNNTPLGDIPAMSHFKKLSDIELCISLSASTYPEAWAGFAKARVGVPCAGGVTAVMAADFYAFLDTGQLVGCLMGMAGAAEYEELLVSNKVNENAYGTATQGMASQSMAHIVIVAFVAIGNIAMYMSLRNQRRSGSRRRKGGSRSVNS